METILKYKYYIIDTSIYSKYIYFLWSYIKNFWSIYIECRKKLTLTIQIYNSVY